MSRIYIFAASPMEGEPVRRMAVSSGSGPALVCGPHEVVLITSGMGPKNAQGKAEAALGAASDAFVATKPDAVLVIGLCGGLTASLAEGQVVTYTECLATDGASPPIPPSPGLVEAAAELLASSTAGCARVVGITSPRIATVREERLDLAGHGAAVVDMESYPILKAAAFAGVPAAVLRVVSDSLDRKLPDFNRALNEAGALDGRKALQVALGSPLGTARLLAANRRAMRRLAAALEIVLRAPGFAS